MKKYYLKIVLAIVCAAFIATGAISAQTDGDIDHGNFCLQNPTAVTCQPSPTPCTDPADCPLGGGGVGGRAAAPADDDDSFIDTVLNFFGFK